MKTSYEMIKAIPAKGFDWVGFNASLRALVVVSLGTKVEAFIHQRSLTTWDAAHGMREVRTAAMEMATAYIFEVSHRQNVIPASDESRMWDSFEGGHRDVWIDDASEEAALMEVADLIAKF